MRVFAQKLAVAIRGALPQAALHSDMSPDEWSLRRGKQDIVEVKA